MAKVSENSLKNLKKFQSGEDAREKGRRGGQAAKKNAQARKTAKECMNLILSKKVTGKKAKQLMENMGIKDEEQQNIMLLMTSIFTKAAVSGDPSAIKTILEIAGDGLTNSEQSSPTININVSAATKEDVEDD